MKLRACVAGQASSAPSSLARLPAPLLSARGALVRGPRQCGAQHLLSSRSCVLAKNSTALGFSSAAPVAFLQVRGGGMARGARVAALAKPAPGPRPPQTPGRAACSARTGARADPQVPAVTRPTQARPLPKDACVCRTSHLEPTGAP